MKQSLMLVALGAVSLSLSGCQKAEEPAPVDDVIEGPIAGGDDSNLNPKVDPSATPTLEGGASAEPVDNDGTHKREP